VSDKQFERMSKQWELYVPPFFSLDNIVINKQIFKRTDTDTLQPQNSNLSREELDRELMDVDEFNFYLDHVHSILDHVLNADFFEFHK
jgi:hypothetical protein